MARKLYPDKWLFAATVGLALFGVVMVYSASAVLAQRDNDNQFHYVIKQGIWTGIGFVVMLAAMQVDYKHLKNPRVVYGLLPDHAHVAGGVCIPSHERRASLDQAAPVLDSAVRIIQARSGDLSCLFPGAACR